MGKLSLEIGGVGVSGYITDEEARSIYDRYKETVFKELGFKEQRPLDKSEVCILEMLLATEGGHIWDDELESSDRQILRLLEDNGLVQVSTTMHSDAWEQRDGYCQCGEQLSDKDIEAGRSVAWGHKDCREPRRPGKPVRRSYWTITGTGINRLAIEKESKVR